MFFFFKQKTAYEMRISDWSSDVCSSDLEQRTGLMVGKRDKALHNGPGTTVHVRMHQTPRRLFQGHERLMDIRRMVPRDDIQHRLHLGTLARLRVRLNRPWLRGQEAGNHRIIRAAQCPERDRKDVVEGKRG